VASSERLQDWFEVERIAPGVTLVGEPMHSEAVKSYLVEGERDVAVIDTGLGVGDFAAAVRELSDRDPIVLQTHAHWDHIGGTHAFQRILVHPNEAYALRRGFLNHMYRPLFTEERRAGKTFPPGFDPDTAEIPACEPTGELNHGDTIDLGGRVLEVFHTPGHSQGGVSFLDRAARLLFVGDAVNFGGTWLFLPRSDAAAFRTTIHLLAELSAHADAIYPAHGPVPMRPKDIQRIAAAFEEVWAGRAPDDHKQWDIGFPEPVPVDVHKFGRFAFLLGTGRYGET
jgi:glyoxylase-like metal-dependent hydrolase (beta-lactamase superfamily II)